MSLSILLKPASGQCNMKCDYCFYMDEMSHRIKPSFGMMTEESLENIIAKTLNSAKQAVTFVYQGGEPTLRGLDFFRRAIKLQKQYNTRFVPIYNSLQTNGYTIDDEWAKFFYEHDFLVGLSIDGTQKTHDINRRDKQGSGTYIRCLEAAELLKQNRVEFNILTVVNRQTAPRIRQIYQSYAKKGFMNQQYIACLDSLFDEDKISTYALTPQMYGDFLVELFEMWYDDLKVGRQPYIRMFENYIGIILGKQSEACEQNGVCAKHHVIEADGGVYPCDFYMLDEYRLGNLNEDSLEACDQRRADIKFIENSYNHSRACQECQYFHLCRGGCRRHRIRNQEAGEYENYFCEAYQQLFQKYYPTMLEIARRCQ